MGKIFEGNIFRFDGGISEDKRSKDFSKFSITKHFDTSTFPSKLVPYFKTVDNNATLPNRTKNIVRFLYAPYLDGTTYKLYGYGVATQNPGSGTRAAVYMLDIDSGSALSTLDWTAPAFNSEGATEGRNTNVFFYYKGWIYMWCGTALMRADTTSGNNFNNAYQSIAPVHGVCQPVHHPNDDVAYFFSDNNVHTLNNTSWTTNALVLPTNQKIVSACAYGNYLAIGTVTLGTTDVRSIVYLWDRDSSLTTLSERIDFGEGTLRYLVVLDNKLTALVGYYLNSNIANTQSKVLVKQYNGVGVVTVNEILVTDNSVTVFTSGNCFIKDNKAYFPLQATLEGDSRLGVWVVDSSGRATIDFQEENANGSYSGIYSTGNIWWIAYGGNGSISYISDTQAFSSTLSSVYESLILNGGYTGSGLTSSLFADSSTQKKLVGVTVVFEPLPSGASVVLKYRKDEETSWTTIFTHTTQNSISHSAVTIESTGALLPEFKEIQFQISSLGGAVITGLKFKGETLDTDLY